MIRKILLFFAAAVILNNSANANSLLDENWCKENGGVFKSSSETLIPPSCYAIDIENNSGFVQKVYAAFTSAFYNSLINNKKPVNLVILENFEIGLYKKCTQNPNQTDTKNSNTWNTFKTKDAWIITKNELGRYI